MNTPNRLFKYLSIFSLIAIWLVLPLFIFAISSPSIISHPAAGLTETEAILNGEITSMGGADNVSAWFEYGLTSGYGSQSNSQSLSTVGIIHGNLSGLTPCTLYHFRAVVQNTDGTVYGSDLTFTTQCQSPNVTIKANNSIDSITVGYNESVSISWLANNVDSCSATGDWSGSKPTSGTYQTENLSSSKTYSINCTGQGGVTASDSVTVSVGNQPTLSVVLEAVPPSGRAPLQNVDLKATVSGAATGNVRYQFDCTNDGSYEKDITITQDPYSPYIAFNLCNYQNEGTYTASVKATRANQTAENTANIQVGQVYSRPTANAGPDKQVNENDSITLDGSGSDPDNDPLTYSWTCTGGSLNNSNVAQPTFMAPSVNSNTTYTCSLTVSDNRSNSDSDSAIISVTDRNSSPEVETQNATNIQNNQATLNGNLRNIGGANYVTVWFQWGTNTSYGNTTPSQPMYSTGAFNSNLANLTPNTAYNFRAVAQNNQGLVYGQNMIFTTTGSNQSYPSANAGPDLQVDEQQSVVLQGSGGDSGGGNVNYSWSCTGGSLNSNNVAQPTYTAPQVSQDITYTCSLTVTNSQGLANSDTMIVSVRNSGGQTSSLVLNKTMQNLSKGDGLWLDSLTATPNQDLLVGINIYNSGQDYARNLYLKDTLPDKLIYMDQMLVDNVSDARVPTLSAISIGDLAPGATKIITFRLKVSPEASFNYGDTTMVNTATVNNDVTTVTDTAGITVTRSNVAGTSTITNINTGLVDDLFNSLALPLLAAGAFVFLFRSQVVGFDEWSQKRKEKTGEYKANKKLEQLVKKVKKDV